MMTVLTIIKAARLETILARGSELDGNRIHRRESACIGGFILSLSIFYSRYHRASTSPLIGASRVPAGIMHLVLDTVTYFLTDTHHRTRIHTDFTDQQGAA